MTISPEEKALLADAYEVKKEQRQLNPADTTAAIQRGLAKARTNRPRINKRMKWITVLFAISLAMVGLLLGPFRDYGQQQQTTSPEPSVHWGKLEPFRELLSKDQERITLASALKHDYVQLIDQTVKRGKYELTVDAVMADENRITMLYSAQMDTSGGIYSIVNTKLTDASTGYVIDNGSIGSLHYSDEHHILRGRTTFERSRSRSLPEKLNFQFQLSSVVQENPKRVNGEGQEKQGPQTQQTQERKYEFSKKMNISVVLDPKFSIPKTEIIPVNRTFKFGDYEVLVAEVELSPLVARVKFDYDPTQKLDYETESFISDIIQPSEIITISKNGERTNLPQIGGSGTGNGMTYSFSSNMLDKPESILLKVRGKPGKAYADLKEAAEDQFEIKVK
ncbi:DUF4179 domain-containing protein [Paenibacillus sp. AN1007]|uniref:DUF4179 domain-containing protein n=1 Tax=Paenibacillus sp. AN1007 TaxID=3151385 RepID=A0AAU8NHI5_9BACL